jgi:site-specific recombinase XerD
LTSDVLTRLKAASKASGAPRRRVGADWLLLDAWCHSMRSRNFSRATLSQYRQTVTRFLFWMVDHDLTVATVTHRDVVRWLDSCKVGPRSRYACTSVLASFYGYLVREEYVELDPTLRVDRPRLGRYLPRPAAHEQIRYALAHAEPRVAAMVALGAFAGMRRAEIAALRVEDLLLHREPPVILVHGKSNRERLVPLHPEILLALRRHGIPKTGWIFPSPPDGPSHPATSARSSPSNSRRSICTAPPTSSDISSGARSTGSARTFG